MEGQEYLNQISASNRPAKGSGLGGILSSKFFWVGMIGVAVLIIILIIGSLIGGTGKKVSDQGLVLALKLHIEGTSSVINEYQPKVKSSNLRSSSASLSSVLNNTRGELDVYLTNNPPGKDDQKSLQEPADQAREELRNELFEAKINGKLDRVYAHKMAYEISLITTEETRIYETTKDDTLKEIIGTSYDSLENLYNAFYDFSETK